jgi:hypothetical protein
VVEHLHIYLPPSPTKPESRSRCAHSTGGDATSIDVWLPKHAVAAWRAGL